MLKKADSIVLSFLKRIYPYKAYFLLAIVSLYGTDLVISSYGIRLGFIETNPIFQFASIYLSPLLFAVLFLVYSRKSIYVNVVFITLIDIELHAIINNLILIFFW